MNLHGSNGDIQPSGDFLIVQSQGDKPRDLELPRGQLVRQLRLHALAILDPLREIDALDPKAALALMDGANTVLENPRRHRLQNNSARAEPGCLRPTIISLLTR